MNKATGNIVSNHENEQNTNEDISFLLSFFFFPSHFIPFVLFSFILMPLSCLYSKEENEIK